MIGRSVYAYGGSPEAAARWLQYGRDDLLCLLRCRCAGRFLRAAALIDDLACQPA